AVLAGRDKLGLRPPAAVARFADWVEQLVAESTGKGGRGVIPVVDDPVAAPYPDGEIVTDFSAEPLALGAAFVAWEYATWELCVRLGEIGRASCRERVEMRGGGGSVKGI